MTCTCYGEELVKVSEDNCEREINSHETEAEKCKSQKHLQNNQLDNHSLALASIFKVLSQWADHSERILSTLLVIHRCGDCFLDVKWKVKKLQSQLPYSI